MNTETEVYRYYKSLYGNLVLLFRVRDGYEAYSGDAETVAKTLRVPLLEGSFHKENGQ